MKRFIEGDDRSQSTLFPEQLTRPGAGARHAEGWRGALDQLAALLERSGACHAD